MKKLVILDRDGVINYDSMNYIKSIDEFKWIPGSLEAIVKLSQAGFAIGVATNQSGIARGLYSQDTLDHIHHTMCTTVRDAGGVIDYIEHCPHMPDSGCHHRKPAPGMLQTIAKQAGVHIQGVPYIGDRITDIQVALEVGAIPHLIFSQMTDLAALANYPQAKQFGCLLDCVEHLINDE